MRVLLIHNYYGSGAPSGENRVFELERDMLLRNGHEVETLERFSDVLRKRGKAGAIAGALMATWNPFAARATAEAIGRFQPDIVHAHNTFPMLSPSVFAAARGPARVLTLHNYRLLCPAAIPMRGGQICTECIDARSVWPAVRHSCYRNSRAATLPLALNVGLNRLRGTWQRDVERFIALTDFQREMFVHGGLPREKISVKPNFKPGEPTVRSIQDRPNRIVFVGRLSEEKGVIDLVEAWLKWGGDAPELRIIGEGPMRDELESRAAGTPRISFLGQVEPVVTEQEIAMARMLILPSRCFETFGMVILEAFKAGTPVSVSDVGSLPKLAAEASGVVFRAGDPDDIFRRVSDAYAQLSRLVHMSAKAAEVFKARYSEAENHRLLIEIYDQALLARREASNRSG